MTFAFFATAAPASQPVPPPDASAPAAAPGSGTTDAFDAALAETLAVIDRQAARPTVGTTGELPMPVEWIFPAFIAPVDPAIAAEQPAAIPSDDELSVETPIEAPSDMSAPPVDGAVVVPIAPPLVMAQAEPVIAAAAATPPPTNGAGPSLETRTGDAIAAAPEAAARPEEVAEPGDVAVASVSERPVQAPSSAGQAIAPVDVAPLAAGPAVAGPAVETRGPASRGPSTGPAPSGSVDTVPVDADATTPVAEPPAASARSGGAPTAAMSESRRAALRYVAEAVQQLQPSEATAPAATPAASATVADIAPAEGVPVPALRAVDVTTAPSDRAESEIAGAVPPESHMSGDQDLGQGQSQGRPSAEFVRFAAALSQSGATDRDDSGRMMAAATPAPGAPAAPSAAAAAPVAPAAPATMTPGEENIGRLVQAMRVNARPGAWEATVRLNPEHLGDVTIALRVERNTVSAVVNAEAAGVRQWLETQEQAVRSGMAEHGLQLERFVVQRDGQRRDTEAHDAPPRQRRRRPAPAADGAERFEVVV